MKYKHLPRYTLRNQSYTLDAPLTGACPVWPLQLVLGLTTPHPQPPSTQHTSLPQVTFVDSVALLHLLN